MQRVGQDKGSLGAISPKLPYLLPCPSSQQSLAGQEEDEGREREETVGFIGSHVFHNDSSLPRYCGANGGRSKERVAENSNASRWISIDHDLAPSALQQPRTQPPSSETCLIKIAAILEQVLLGDESTSKAFIPLSKPATTTDINSPSSITNFTTSTTTTELTTPGIVPTAFTKVSDPKKEATLDLAPRISTAVTTTTTVALRDVSIVNTVVDHHHDDAMQRLSDHLGPTIPGLHNSRKSINSRSDSSFFEHGLFDSPGLSDSTSLAHSVISYTTPLTLGLCDPNPSSTPLRHCPTRPALSSLGLTQSALTPWATTTPTSSYGLDKLPSSPASVVSISETTGPPASPPVSLSPSAVLQGSPSSAQYVDPNTGISIVYPTSICSTAPQECSLTHTYTPSNLSCSSSSSLSFAVATSFTSTLCDIKKPRESSSSNSGVHRRSSRKGNSWVRQISRYCIRSNRISSTTSGLFAHHQQGSKINNGDKSSRSVKNNATNTIADTDSIINTTSSNFVSKMLKLARNHSMPVSTNSNRNIIRSSNGQRSSRFHTNSFSFASLNRTLSEKSITDTMSPGSHHQNSNNSNAESGSMSPSSWTTLAGPSALHAVLISHILRGEFLQISDVGLDALIRDMTGKGSKALELIKITGAVISGTDAKLLAKLIRSSEAVNIKVLRLDRNAISQDAFRFIFDAWKMNRTITTLSMSRAGVNDKTIKYIAKALAKNTSIKELDLSSNRITSSGIEVLCNALIFNRTLTRLCLQSNNIKKAGAPFLATLLAKNRVIRHLNIGSNGLGNEGCVLIAEAVRFNRALSSLSLDMNEMGHVGATAMAAALQSNRHLMYLYISHNNIGDQGLADMCESLKRNNTIIGLDIEMNQICNGQSLVGIQALADVLKVNTCLRELNLSYNIFTGEAIKSLMEGVDLNSTLESIMLTNCCVATEGALAIAEILPSAKGLQNLGLTANPDIAVEGYWALATGISKNRSMKGIQLDYNSDDRHDLYDSIQQSLTTNFIWQQAIYKASCRILVLARIVLLGRPVRQRMLQSQQLLQQQQQQHSGGGAWKLLRKVGIGRTSSSNSLTSLLSLSKIKSGDSVGGSSSNGADGGEGTTTDGIKNTSPTPTRQQYLGNQLLLPHRQLQLMDQGLLLGQPHLQPHFQDQSCYLNSPPASRSHSPSISQPEQQQQEYNAHKVMAHLGNMPYEILENICSFLDPGRNMTIAQIRATIEVAGTRSTLTPYYTKAKMLERIFCSRYIPSVGLRYSIRNGEERP